MKRLFFLLLFVTQCWYSFAQISVRKLDKTEVAHVYDSTRNFNADIYAHIGREALLLAKSSYNTDTVIKGLTPSDYILFSKVGKHAISIKDYSAYGKYYIINNVVMDTLFMSNTMGYAEYVFFQLTEKETKSTIYYKLGMKINTPKLDNRAPLLMIDYFNYQKQLCFGKALTTRVESNDLIDINTRKPTIISASDTLTCVDVTLIDTDENPFMQPSYIIKSASGKEVAIPFTGFGKNAEKQPRISRFSLAD